MSGLSGRWRPLAAVFDLPSECTCRGEGGAGGIGNWGLGIREGVPLMRHEYIWGQSSNGTGTMNRKAVYRGAGCGVREGGGLSATSFIYQPSALIGHEYGLTPIGDYFSTFSAYRQYASFPACGGSFLKGAGRILTLR